MQIMRMRILMTALLAGSMITPALAQRSDGERGPRAERMQRGDAARSPYRGQSGEGRREWQGRQVTPQVQQQQPPVAQVIPERTFRADRPQRPVQPEQANGALAPAPDRGFRRREAPAIGAAPVLNSGERRFRDRDGDGIRNGRDFDRNNDGVVDRRFDRNRNGIVDRRIDGDRDGIRNWRDRDRDNDGIRNRRDWDRNNDGNVDRRWDRNRNGIVDRRFDSNRDGVRDWNGNRGNWNRDWRNDRRYDWQRYRYSNRSLYRQPRYYSPYGYGYSYQRFGIGIYLNSAFFGSRYYIDNPYDYRLPQASWPYRWVRYYDDVLLVDTRNGYVVDVIHDFFW
jgi:Nickel/cobalt transporter regulator